MQEGRLVAYACLPAGAREPDGAAPLQPPEPGKSSLRQGSHIPNFFGNNNSHFQVKLLPVADRRGAVCRFFYARKFPCVLSIRIVGSLSWSPVFSGGGFCTAPVSCVVRGSRADCGFRAIARLQARNARASYGISVVASGSGGYSCLLRAVVWPIWRLMDGKQTGTEDPG